MGGIAAGQLRQFYLIYYLLARIRLPHQTTRQAIKTIVIGNTYAISERGLPRFAATPRRPGRPRRNIIAY
jgi:hypothetical protein